MKKLSKKSEQVVEDFERAVIDNQFEEGDPCVDNAEELEKRHEETKEALIKRLWYLEQKVKRLQAKDF